MRKATTLGIPAPPPFAETTAVYSTPPVLSVILSLCILLPGCASGISARAQNLELDMSKNKVIRVLGHRHSTVAARQEGTGQRLEVLKFEDKAGNTMLGYFRDGKLVQWGDPSALANMPD